MKDVLAFHKRSAVLIRLVVFTFGVLSAHTALAQTGTPTAAPMAPRRELATLNTTEDAKQVGISAFDYYFSNHWRLYVRTTLTVEDQDAEAEEDAESGDTPAEEPTAEDLSETVKLALLDPFGGGLNVSSGYYRKIKTPFLKGDANDLHHGLFADVRGGFKFIELPATAANSGNQGVQQ